jgi:isopentenyl diphosphate isomerase/L-lactate dehydrogenase-like FMN-dependent dehydrogenase
MDKQAALSWRDIERFKKTHKTPLILKGIATVEDALIALDHGVEGIYVSNHGGRQLDHGRGAMEFFPEIVEAVAGRAKLIVDGGFSRGTDIVKGMALGADVVAIGRLSCYGLAADGAAGVRRVLELLEAEIRVALGLLGVDRFAALDKSYIHAAASVTRPHVHSAFPLLEEGY